MSVKEKDNSVAAVTHVSAQTAQNTKSQVTSKYDRKIYENTKKMNEFKKNEFSTKKTIKDPYSGNELHIDHNAAKNKYGNAKASLHQAETDHITPLKQIHDYSQNMSYITDADIKNAANREHNLKIISKKDNRAKKDLYGTEYADKSKTLSDEGKKALKRDAGKSNRIVKAELLSRDIGRAAADGAKTGIAAGAIMSVSTNISAVARGEKSVIEAAHDTLVDTVKSGVSGAGISSAVEATKFGVTSLERQITKKLGEKTIGELASKGLTVVSNNIGTIVSVIITTGDTFMKYFKGEIDGTELIIELGEKGTGLTSSMLAAEAGTFIGAGIGAGIGAAIGGVLGSFTIPGLGTLGGAELGADIGADIGAFIGGVIASAVGYFLGSELYRRVKAALADGPSAKESKKLQETYHQITEQINKYNQELEQYLSYIHAEHRRKIKQGFQNMLNAVTENDIKNATIALSDICKQFNTDIEFKTKDNFDSFMNDRNSVFSI